jgi:dehydrogenase/reductase SDR family protein 12
VLTTTSSGMYFERFDLAKLELEEDSYKFATAYARSKRAQVVLAAELARRHDPSQVSFHAVHPGWVDTVSLAEGLPAFTKLVRPFLRTPDEGCDTIVWLAGAPAGTIGTGRLWHDRRPRSTTRFPGTGDLDTGAELVAWIRERASRGGVTV